jgi:hypothetical protein
MDMPPLAIPPRIKKRGGARIYDDGGQECPPSCGGAAVYDAPEQAELFTLGEQIDIETRAGEPRPYLTITSNPS